MTKAKLIRAHLVKQVKCPAGYQTTLSVNATETHCAVIATEAKRRSSNWPVLVFDAALRKVADFHVKTRLYGIDVSPDGKEVALATELASTVYSLAGKRLVEFPHEPCDKTWLNDCRFSRDGRLLWTLHQGKPPRVVVIDAAKQVIRDEYPIDFEPEPDRGLGSHFMLHPGDDVVLARIFGLEVTRYFRCEFREVIHVEQLPPLDELFVSTFAPSGKFLLAADFDSDGFIGRFRFPSCQLIKKIEPSGRWYSYDVVLLSEQTALFRSPDGRLLLVDIREFQPVAEVLPEGFDLAEPWWSYEAQELDPWQEIRAVGILSPTRWVTKHVEGTLKLWEVHHAI